MNDDTKAPKQIELCESNIDEKKKNIMMMHCSVGAHYLMQEFGEWVYPKDKEYIFSKMDYVALGHWHGFGQVGKHENVYYSGSTERTSLNDKRNSKGFVELTLDSGSLFGALDVLYKEIKIRPILTKEIDCSDFESSLDELDTTDTKDAIVEVRLKNLTALQSIEIQNSQIKGYFSDAMSVSVKREFSKDVQQSDLDGIEALSLEEFFLEHVKEDAEAKEYDRLKNKIQELFANYEEVQDDTN
jgi:DNA repair exonuclease SbcCD nuclease subunit